VEREVVLELVLVASGVRALGALETPVESLPLGSWGLTPCRLQKKNRTHLNIQSEQNLDVFRGSHDSVVQCKLRLKYSGQSSLMKKPYISLTVKNSKKNFKRTPYC
jgi:hypothetical protein